MKTISSVIESILDIDDDMNVLQLPLCDVKLFGDMDNTMELNRKIKKLNSIFDRQQNTIIPHHIIFDLMQNMLEKLPEWSKKASFDWLYVEIDFPKVSTIAFQLEGDDKGISFDNLKYDPEIIKFGNKKTTIVWDVKKMKL